MSFFNFIVMPQFVAEWRLFRFILAIDHTHSSLERSMCSRVHADPSLVVSKTTTYYSKERRWLIIVAAFWTYYLWAFYENAETRLSFQIKQYGKIWENISPRADEDVECVRWCKSASQELCSHVLVVCFSSCCSSSPVWGRLHGTMAAWLCWWRMTGKSITRCLTLKIWLVCEPCQHLRWRNDSQLNHSWVQILKPPAPSAEYKWYCVGSKNWENCKQFLLSTNNYF